MQHSSPIAGAFEHHAYTSKVTATGNHVSQGRQRRSSPGLEMRGEHEALLLCAILINVPSSSGTQETRCKLLTQRSGGGLSEQRCVLCFKRRNKVPGLTAIYPPAVHRRSRQLVRPVRRLHWRLGLSMSGSNCQQVPAPPWPLRRRPTNGRPPVVKCRPSTPIAWLDWPRPASSAIFSAN